MSYPVIFPRNDFEFANIIAKKLMEDASDNQITKRENLFLTRSEDLAECVAINLTELGAKNVECVDLGNSWWCIYAEVPDDSHTFVC